MQGVPFRYFSSIRLILACGLFCLADKPVAFATSIVFSTFAQPVLIDGKIVVISPANDRVLGFNQKGKLLWNQPFTEISSIFPDKKGALRLTHAGAICILDTDSGKMLSSLPINTAIKEIGYIEDEHLLQLSDPDWKKSEITLLDADSGKPLRTEADAERVVYADKDRIVFIKSQRITSGEGYQFKKLWLEAKSRTDWNSLWKIKLKRNTPWITARLIEGKLCVPDQQDLLLIEPGSGDHRRVSSKIADTTDLYRWELRMDGNRFYYLSTGPRSSKDYNSTVHRIHWCTLPDLEVSQITDFKSSKLPA